MRVLVTGANSMLGGNIVEILSDKGYDIIALVRRSCEVVDRCCKVIIGNVGKIDDLRKAADGCDAIVHVAAITSQSPLKLSDYSFNWEVAHSVGVVAKEVGCKKVVFISSANSVGNGFNENQKGNETSILRKPYVNSLYGQSKVIAERMLREVFEDAIIINPTFMIGKYDSKPSSGMMIKLGFRKRFVIVPCGGKDFVAAKDVANLVMLAIESEGVKGRFLASGGEMRVKEFMLLMAQEFGYKTTVWVLPKWMLVVAGGFGDFIRFFGIKAPFSGINMRILAQREFYCNEKAKRELGYSNSPINCAIRDAAVWMQNNGVI